MSINIEYLSDRDRELYETHIRRLRYDDRDCIMYENMLDFLWDFVIGKKSYREMDDIYNEYTYWNQGIITKVLYHDHSIAEANIHRCYQSILELIRHNPDGAYAQIEAIGKESFSYDGLAPKVRMDAKGHVFRPVSKLFILYNIAKYYKIHGMLTEYEQLQKEYSYAFTTFDDEEHRSHDQYLKEQMEVLSDKIIYPIEEKVYKIPWGPKDFYLYFDENSFLTI